MQTPFEGKSKAEIRERHSQSCEGEWIYSRETNCRFCNIFEDLPDCEAGYNILAFSVALAMPFVHPLVRNEHARIGVSRANNEIFAALEFPNLTRLFHHNCLSNH